MSEASTAPTPKKPARKLILFGALGLLLAAGAAGGAWFALGQRAGAHAAQARHQEPEKPLYSTLEPFTVNLADPRGDRFAQIGITLEFTDPATDSAIKDRLPTVRNAILLLISSKQVEELLSAEGKRALAQQIRLLCGRALGVDLPEPGAPAGKTPPPENPIRAVLFSQFIVQ
jgi:flagellar FliL protein